METYLKHSSYVDIAPNEYVTKFSLNRNFQKLISNDIALLNAANDDNIAVSHRIETYNKTKTYDAQTYVFYKIHPDDTQFYILKSIKDPNTHKPTVRKDISTGKMFVINSDWWQIVGLAPGSESSPKDIADNDIQRLSDGFEQRHELNTELSAHPTGKLGFKQSDILYKTFDNIADERSVMHYPYAIESFVGDNTIYYGYMRKWDNGLLEYDLTFRLGYISSDTAGIQLISANNVIVDSRNYNYLYFKDNNDMQMFRQGGEYYTNVNGMKQVNLNKSINAYTGKIRFIEPFKDLNYMVFTSNIKNVETEAFNTKNEAISAYDSRFIIDGLSLVGIKEGATFKTKATVPPEVRNICTNALAQIQQVDGYEVYIEMLSGSSLMNIDEYAFQYSAIERISIPAATRHIASNAFLGCAALSSVCIYTYSDPTKQVVIDPDAFAGTAIESLSIVYVDDAFLPSQYVQLSTKITSERGAAIERLGMHGELSVIMIAADGSKNIITKNDMRRGAFQAQAAAIARSAKMAFAASNPLSHEHNEEANSNTFTIDVNELLSELQAEQHQPKKMMLKAPQRQLFSAPPLPDVASMLLIDNDHKLIGFDESVTSSIMSDISIQLPNDVVEISENALSGFTQLTSFAINGNTLTSTGANFIDTNTCQQLILDNTSCGISLSGTLQTLCVSYDSDVTYRSNISIDAIKDIYIAADSISSIISARTAQNLNVIGIKLIDTNAFYGISGISRCAIYASDDGLTCHGQMFRNDIDNYTVYHFRMYGSNYTIASNTFAGINSDYLSIGMEGTIVDTNAFSSAFIENLYFIGEIHNQSQLCAGCLNNINSYAIVFPSLESISEYSILSTSTNSNRLNIPDNIQVGLSTESYYYSNGDIFFVPPNLCVQNGILISAILDEIGSQEQIIIPRIVTAISSHALDLVEYDPVLSNAIQTIRVPNTVRYIGDYAFARNDQLQDIIFEPGMQFDYVGTGIVSGCTQLLGIVWKTLP